MKKLYYTIGEVSQMTGVKPHVLRYWESIFDRLNPSKNRAGNRVYKQSDIDTIYKLKKLIREEKYSTAGAKKAIRGSKTRDAAAGGDEINGELREDLARVRSLLNDLLKEMDG